MSEEATEVTIELSEVIKAAKLGRSRKDAQQDTCTVFAAALYDILKARGISCRIVTAACGFLGRTEWYHAVVKVDGHYYDSMGEFSEDIWRARAKIHPKVQMTISYRPDTRTDCYEDEFDEMHAFYLKMLNKAMTAAEKVTV